MKNVSFKLKIELGNAAMSNTDDVATALRKAADRLEKYYAGPTPIFDINGNRVGEYEIVVEN